MILYQLKINNTFEFMFVEVHLVPVASISGHTKPRDNAQNSLYQQDVDAVQSLNAIKTSQYITFLPNDIHEQKNSFWKSFRRLQG